MSGLPFPRRLWLLAATSVLAACGSDGGGSDTGRITVAVTDSPVDVAEAVVVEFTGVELKPKNGPAISRDFPVPMTIDLLAYQNGERVILLDEVEVPAGEYNWMRLKVLANPDEAGDSYITIAGSQCELGIPSGDERGLQMIRGFTVGVGTTTDITVDFDLRSSVLQPPGQTTTVPECDGQAYVLKPVLRLVDMLEVGTITGAVDPNLIGGQCGTSPQSPAYPGNVYLFGPVTDAEPALDDYDLVVDDPNDPNDSKDPNGENALASAMVDPDTFTYTIGYVPAGNYRLAYTCDVDSVMVDADKADEPTAEADEVVEFTPAEGVAVTVTGRPDHNGRFPAAALISRGCRGVNRGHASGVGPYSHSEPESGPCDP